MTKHHCSFSTLVRAAVSVGELERLAGVCDREITWRAAARAFRQSDQWPKLMSCLRRRIGRRYDRGELVQEEARAVRVWCGELPSLFSSGGRG